MPCNRGSLECCHQPTWLRNMAAAVADQRCFSRYPLPPLPHTGASEGAGTRGGRILIDQRVGSRTGSASLRVCWRMTGSPGQLLFMSVSCLSVKLAFLPFPCLLPSWLWSCYCQIFGTHLHLHLCTGCRLGTSTAKAYCAQPTQYNKHCTPRSNARVLKDKQNKKNKTKNRLTQDLQQDSEGQDDRETGT